MALKKDLSKTCEAKGARRPIDLVYLSSQTMGDAKLEAEVLSMFAGQLPSYVKSLCAADDPAEISKYAHTLKGAARSIGAFDLAELAMSAEDAGFVDEAAIMQETKAVLVFINSIS